MDMRCRAFGDGTVNACFSDLSSLWSRFKREAFMEGETLTTAWIHINSGDMIMLSCFLGNKQYNTMLSIQSDNQRDQFYRNSIKVH